MDVMKELSKIGIVPVIAINDAADAVPMAKALIEGGLPAAEVTFRTPCAAEAIKAMADAFPEMIVGAGTVLTTEQVDRAVAAGAKFIVSPGLNPTTVKYCQEIGVPVCPGTANPSDIELALSLGLRSYANQLACARVLDIIRERNPLEDKKHKSDKDKE